ncbi:MAG: hypothetical protein HYT87_17580 [Nitrospirae bacterium]|nr:hypothetical protein [Nitrospirota bacterium]
MVIEYLRLRLAKAAGKVRYAFILPWACYLGSSSGADSAEEHPRRLEPSIQSGDFVERCAYGAADTRGVGAEAANELSKKMALLDAVEKVIESRYSVEMVDSATASGESSLQFHVSIREADPDFLAGMQLVSTTMEHDEEGSPLAKVCLRACVYEGGCVTGPVIQSRTAPPQQHPFSATIPPGCVALGSALKIRSQSALLEFEYSGSIRPEKLVDLSMHARVVNGIYQVGTGKTPLCIAVVEDIAVRDLFITDIDYTIYVSRGKKISSVTSDEIPIAWPYYWDQQTEEGRILVSFGPQPMQAKRSFEIVAKGDSLRIIAADKSR